MRTCCSDKIYALQGQRTDAIDQLTRAIELDSNSSEAYNILGTALDRFAEFDEARKAFEQAVALDPHMIEAHINLAMCLAESGDLKSAAGQLTTAIQLHPVGPSAAHAHYLLAKIYQDQDSKRAIDELVISARLNPSDEQTWLELGGMRDAVGDQPGALAAFLHAVALTPRDPEAQYQLGSEYLAAGDARSAVTHLELARKSMPKPTLALLYKLDRSLRKIDDAQEAEKVRDEAKALLTQDSEANAHFQQAEGLEDDGLSLQDGGDLAGALKKFKAALEINPQDNRFRYNYALALCHADHWQEGIAELNEVLENDPGNIDARRALFIAKDKAKLASNQPRAKAP